LILIILGIGNSITLLIVSNMVELELDTTPVQMFMALLGAYPMLLAYFGIGLFLGAFMPSRRLAVAVLAFIYLASYVLNSIGNLVESMTYFKTVSLFSYFNASTTVFTEGQHIGDVAILLSVALIFFGLAVYTFESRNITVGEWFWQRSKIPAKVK
jgi:ABC-2 type transport system permease protein